MSEDPNPRVGAEALATLLSLLEALNAHLERELQATLGDFHRLRAQRPSDADEFSRLVTVAREACITVGLQPSEYSSTLERVDRLYREMIHCPADPTAATQHLQGDLAEQVGRRLARDDLRASRHGYIDLRIELDRLVKDVSARFRMRVEQPYHKEASKHIPPPQGADVEVESKNRSVGSNSPDKPKSRTGRPPNPDPSWVPTAISLKPKFVRGNRTDWQEFAKELRKQVAEGDPEREKALHKEITPGKLKQFFNNKRRQKG